MIWLIIVAAFLPVASTLSCLNEFGAPVAWFIVLKLPNGGRYVYADAQTPYFVVCMSLCPVMLLRFWLRFCDGVFIDSPHH
jgi:hypothetical protein